MEDEETPSRDPPKEIKALLRQEVNFGCPIRYPHGEGCGCPILTYHHFDPPWAGNFLHNPAGMVALCHMHHDQADGGAWTKRELQEFKKHPYVDSEIKCRWPWTAEKLLVQFGQCLILEQGCPLWLFEKPILGFRPYQNPNFGNEVVVFDSYIESRAGEPWMVIEDGSLSVKTGPTHDFAFSPQTNAFKAHHRDGTQLNLRFRRVRLHDFNDWWRAFNRAKQFNSQNGYASSQDLVNKFNIIDADGRIPIISVTGDFTTSHVSVKIGPHKMTAQCLLPAYNGPQGHLECTGRILAGGSMRMVDAETQLEFQRMG
jgi:hypothetical protein